MEGLSYLQYEATGGRARGGSQGPEEAQGGQRRLMGGGGQLDSSPHHHEASHLDLTTNTKLNFTTKVDLTLTLH